jgi:hypothetical protein
MVATKSWLIDQGLSLHFLDNAIRSQTLTPLAAGVYTLYETPASWQSVAASVQRMSKEPIQVGGLTALDFVGLTHFLSTSAGVRIQLYSSGPLPGWISRIPITAHFERHGTLRLWPESVMTNPRFLRQLNWQEGLPPIAYSCPERAILEALTEVPSTVSFEHAAALIQGLSNLSSKKIDSLLRECRHIKVKRLFLWLAERQGHAWFKHLEPSEYNLGSGKRLIAKRGKLSTRWAITVPKEMHENTKHG